MQFSLSKKYLQFLIVGSVFIGVGMVYAAISFDDDDSGSWYGPNEPNGRTDPIATAILDGNFMPGECPPPPVEPGKTPPENGEKGDKGGQKPNPSPGPGPTPSPGYEPPPSQTIDSGGY